VSIENGKIFSYRPNQAAELDFQMQQRAEVIMA
jgi:hypothetical protein